MKLLAPMGCKNSMHGCLYNAWVTGGSYSGHDHMQSLQPMKCHFSSQFSIFVSISVIFAVAMICKTIAKESVDEVIKQR